jgi:DNA-binding transcriptional LysR family regulator
VYIDSCKQILDIERQMQSRFSDIAEYRSGTITVGIAPTRCQYLMPEIVKRFSKIYPGIHLVIEERFLGNLLEDAARGQFDLCVATLPVDETVFSYDLMMREEVVLAVPKKSALNTLLKKHAAKQEGRIYPAVDIRLIAGAEYVAISDTQPTQALLNRFCTEYNFSVKTAVKCMSIETQFSMVKAGVGAALIPSSLSKYTLVDSVDYYSLEQNAPNRDMAIVYRKGQYLSKAMIALKEIMITV